MLELSILRHAKSSWDDDRLPDFDRPLAPRGRKAAPRIGRYMRDIGLAPDLVLCSPSVRTRETARLVLAQLDTEPPLTIDPSIYEADVTQLRASIARAPPSTRRLLLIGHNPGLQRLVLELVGPDLAPEHGQLRDKLPTAALVVLGVDVPTWADLAPGSARILRWMTPRHLPESD
jgi:phosphohistidine phosphatase